jgi:hypothetical protein
MAPCLLTTYQSRHNAWLLIYCVKNDLGNLPEHHFAGAGKPIIRKLKRFCIHAKGIRDGKNSTKKAQN